MKILNLFSLFVLLLICSCSDEPDTNPPSVEQCLENQIAEDGFLDCSVLNNSCPTELLDQFNLSQSMKQRFPDYCLAENNVINFEDAQGETLSVLIKSKRFSKNRAILTLSPGNFDCQNFCMENEIATMELECSRFSLDINLWNNIKLEFDQTGEPNPKPIGEANIMAKLGNTKQTVFSMILEDEEGMTIEPDTFSIRHHSNIQLNGNVYTDIYSNENNNATSLLRNEKVYYDPNLGLVAVRDSLGVLWSRK